MMLRRAAMKLLGAFTLFVGMGIAENANAAEIIKIDPAPKSSPWGQVFTVWEKAVKEKNEGRSSSSSSTTVAGRRGGDGRQDEVSQLDGAAVTPSASADLQTDPPSRSPGCHQLGEADAARDAMKGEPEA